MFTMRGRVLHRASPELNICCANISWVRFYKIGSGRVGKGGDACAHTQTSLSSLRKLDRVARAASTMKAGANFTLLSMGSFFQNVSFAPHVAPTIGETKKPGAMAGGMTHY
jgi:hypothetical protein